MLNIFKKISDEDCIALGMNPQFSRPDWMILTILPVPPPPVRPSIMMDSMLRSEDDLTFKLADILRACQHYVNMKLMDPLHILYQNLSNYFR